MSVIKTESKRGRPHDAAGAREAILNGAEEIFAEHGFDGARIDAIAAAAGYNKSLLFNYYGDKLGLYAEVIRRADEQTRSLQGQALAALFEDETVITAERLKALLRKYMSAYFDYLIDHPRFTRILLWEMAEGWQTYAKVLSQHDLEDVSRFKPLVQRLQEAGLLRADFDPTAQIVMIEFLVPCYLACLPLLQSLQPSEDFSSADAFARTREFAIDFIVQGLVFDPSEKKR